jgi:outer membrane lipoprotein-sorting protein
MNLLRKALRCSILSLIALTATTFTLPAKAADDLGNLDKVLARLDASAAKFKSAQADIVWDNVQTQPVEDKDSQVGTVLFERKGGQLQMALHLKTDNGKPVEKQMVYAGGLFKLYEPRIKQMQVFQAGANRAQYDMFLTVGFGGSGKELQKNWEVSYVGTEPVDGVSAAKLQLIPRDESLRKSITKVFLWIDMDKGVAVKQQSFDPTGNYRMVVYHGIKLNVATPSDAFEIKTAQGTQTVNH